MRAKFADHAKSGELLARVVRIDRGEADVVTDQGQLRVSMTKAAKDVVVGDWVCVHPGDLRINAILERSSCFVRRASRGVRRPQAIAANVTYAVLCQPLDRELNLRRIERELVLAFDSGATPVILLTKSDVVGPAEATRLTELASTVSAGCTVLASNIEASDGLDAFRAAIPPAAAFALLGASGAGKSSLANVLAGHPIQRVAEVRQGDAKGRHTTTAAELFLLDDGRLLLDTPGVRALALWVQHRGLELAFPEITQASQRCRFDDCRHDHEPGCRIAEQLEAGNLDLERVESWRRMREEIELLESELETSAWSQRR